MHDGQLDVISFVSFALPVSPMIMLGIGRDDSNSSKVQIGIVNFTIFCSLTVTQFILEQQELKLKKNSKSRKKRKQNTDEEEGNLHVIAAKVE